MKSTGRPFNGPSTTGNPSGPGRGNNPPGNTRAGGNGITRGLRVFNPDQRVIYIHPGRPDNYGQSYTIGRYVSGHAWRGEDLEFKRESQSGRVSQNKHDNFFVRASDERSIVNIASNGSQMKLTTVLKRHGSDTVRAETIGTVTGAHAKTDGSGPYYYIKFDGLDEIISVPSVYLKWASQ